MTEYKTHISVSIEIRDWIKSLKLVDDETYDSVLKRIRSNWSPDNILYEKGDD